MPATLASLHVRNLALVEEARLEPPAGFLSITGETGAGKSVLIGALNMILGGRADRSLIRSGAEACAVEAVFENAGAPEIARLLEDAGADPCEEGRLLLRRTLHASGPGRQFANGCACTLRLLRGIGERLVDLH
ncbi:MAG: AAA family ATPase, partial [Terrimicrobiaceae bacterium]|nr:AAA family ATPase [Terrimicrobiaceae bacterium]